VIEDHGVTFPKGNAAELANTLQRLCDHPDMVQRFQEHACDYICTKYNWDDVTEKTLALYRQCKENRMLNHT
jgi:glycosyltransferase involved in cell wall biosynthesis